MDDVDGSNKSIPAYPAGRSAGVVLFADNFDAECAFSLNSGDNSYRLPFELEDRTLLDVRLKKRVRFPSKWTQRQRRLGGKDLFERRLDGHARGILERVDVGELSCPGKNGRTHHTGREARAFFVHPCNHVDASTRLNPCRTNRFHDLDAGQKAVRAVEFPAGGLTVDVRSDEDRRQAVVAAGQPQEKICGCVR